MSFLTVGTVATQRGRAPQLFFMKSSTSSAVVLGSTVTGLSCGAGGALTLPHSVTMSAAPAATGERAKATANNSAQPTCFAECDMFSSLGPTALPRAPLAFAMAQPMPRRLPGVGAKGKDGIPGNRGWQREPLVLSFTWAKGGSGNDHRC